MKLLRNIAILLSLLTAPALRAQCNGDFSWFSNGLTYSFYATTSPNVTHVTWSFGDGNYDFTNNLFVQHTYAATGTYQVCLIFSDSASACLDSTCHIIALDSCYGSFTFTATGQLVTFDGTAHGAGPNTVFNWNFGDSSSGSNQEDPVHNYSQPGTYIVCFSYYDAASGCSDSVCAPVTVGASACNADFSWIDTLGTCFFINNSTPGGGYYVWDFGDGNYSYQENPSNNYSQAGTYLVCLIAYDSNQVFCDSTCEWVNVAGPAASSVEETSRIRNVGISPNPATDAFTLHWNQAEAGEASVTLSDISGRTVKVLTRGNFSAGQQQQQFSTEDLSSGTYIVQVNANGQCSRSRLVVSHTP